MAIFRGNEKERIQANWPRGFLWPGNVPANVAQPDTNVGKGAEFVVSGYFLPDLGAVLHAGVPPEPPAPPTDLALGQLVVLEPHRGRDDLESFSRHFVPPDLVFTAFGSQLTVAQELPIEQVRQPVTRHFIEPVTLEEPPLRGIVVQQSAAISEATIVLGSTTPPVAPAAEELVFGRTAIVGIEEPIERVIPAITRHFDAEEVIPEAPPPSNRVISGPQSSAFDLFTLGFNFESTDSVVPPDTAIPLPGLFVRQSRDIPQPDAVFAFSVPYFNPRGQLVVARELPVERRQSAVLGSFVPPNLVYTAFGTRVIVNRELPQDRIQPAFTRNFVPPDFVPPEEPQPIAVIVVQENVFRTPDAVLQHFVPPDVIFTAFGNQIIAVQEQPAERRDPVILSGYNFPIVYTAFGTQVVVKRELPVERTQEAVSFSGFVPPDYIPVIAEGLRRKRHWRRGSSA